MLAAEIVALGWTAAALSTDRAVTGQDWMLAALLGLCAHGHMVWTRPQEERRRGQDVAAGGEHIDHTAVWTVAAALALPVPLAVALLLYVRVQRWFIARRPPHRFLFSTAGHTMSVLGAHAVMPLHAAPVPATPLGLALLLGLALAAYFVAQTAVIAGARALVTPPGEHSWTGMVGTREDNSEFGQLLVFGAAAALAAVFAWPLLALVTACAVHETRQTQHRLGLLQIQTTLQDAVYLDELTGLTNRRGLDQLGGVVVDLARPQSPVAVLMVDLDRFKRINDTYGHFDGDRVLVAVAAVLREERRKHDVVGRWGGEEYLLVLPGVALPQAVQIAERIRAKVAAITITLTRLEGGGAVEFGPGRADRLSLSIGIAMAPTNGTSLVAVQQIADTAMMRAKRLGRDQVQVGPTATDINHPGPALKPPNPQQWPSPTRDRDQSHPLGEDVAPRHGAGGWLGGVGGGEDAG